MTIGDATTNHVNFSRFGRGGLLSAYVVPAFIFSAENLSATRQDVIRDNNLASLPEYVDREIKGGLKHSMYQSQVLTADIPKPHLDSKKLEK